MLLEISSFHNLLVDTKNPDHVRFLNQLEEMDTITTEVVEERTITVVQGKAKAYVYKIDRPVISKEIYEQARNEELERIKNAPPEPEEIESEAAE